MPINAISQASGADLLSLYSQSVGEGGAPVAVAASTAALKSAIAEAKMSESALVGGDTGSQLNVYV
jgi:hypothetical protein